MWVLGDGEGGGRELLPSPIAVAKSVQRHGAPAKNRTRGAHPWPSELQVAGHDDTALLSLEAVSSVGFLKSKARGSSPEPSLRQGILCSSSLKLSGGFLLRGVRGERYASALRGVCSSRFCAKV